MNILTFDIEDWYCHDNLSRDLNWDKFEVRLYEGIDRILSVLSEKGLKGSFFCLGWVAEKHPDIIKRIVNNGHEIGCHSYQHELIWRQTQDVFKAEIDKSKKILEDVSGSEVSLFRAPAFSITDNSLFAIDILYELGFKYDCSIFPARRDFGGMPSYGSSKPALISHNGLKLKEFPINPYKLMGKNLVYSGGGYFRIMPYSIIKFMTNHQDYVMTYFHPSDFDPDQPQMNYLPKLRQWKNKVGLKTSYAKFQQYLSDYEFICVSEADKRINWSAVPVIEF